MARLSTNLRPQSPEEVRDRQELERFEAALGEAIRAIAPRLRALQPALRMSIGYGYDSGRHSYVVSVLVFGAAKESVDAFRCSLPGALQLELHNPDVTLALPLLTQQAEVGLPL